MRIAQSHRAGTTVAARFPGRQGMEVGKTSNPSTTHERSECMSELKAEPTKWNEMAGPFIGGRDTYQAKSYGFKSNWGPYTTAGPAPVWFSEANATNWTESMI